MKKKAVEFMGGKCVECGYNKCLAALQFHHVIPTEKDYHFSDTLTSKSWKEVQEELKKCQLVCSNCHAEIHDKQRRNQNDLYEVSQ